MQSILGVLSAARPEFSPLNHGDGQLVSSSSDDSQRTPSVGRLNSDKSKLPVSAAKWTERFGLTLPVLDHLLDRYRTAQHFFPFVEVPSQCSAERMLGSRPSLLLAVLTVTAARHTRLQSQLAREFRDMLARRVVVDGESDLDLFEGLLVHLAWYTSSIFT